MTTAYTRTTTGLTVFHNDKSYNITSDHPKFKEISLALFEERYDDLDTLIVVKEAIADWFKSYPDITIENRCINLNGEPFTSAVTEKVFRMLEGGHAPGPLVRFLRKLRRNPSSSSQAEALLFLTANNFLIGSDGNIVGYKGVSDQYLDYHSGKFRNKVGDTNKMERHLVDDNRNNTCSRGFHVGSFEYARDFARSDGHLMLVTVDPANIVSIPSDHSNQKMRCCEYTVIGELEGREKIMEEVYRRENAEYVPPVEEEEDEDVSVEDRVLELIGGYVDSAILADEEVRYRDHLANDLELTLEDRINLWKELESEFGIAYEDNDVLTRVRVGDIVTFVQANQ